jgi:hypothetical protein
MSIKTKQPKMIGILTNFKEWIFTKYSLADEVSKIYEACSGNSSSGCSSTEAVVGLNPFDRSLTLHLTD